MKALIICGIFYRHDNSNCPDEVLIEGEGGVQSVESAAVPENEQRIVTPPDSLVAQEINSIVNRDCMASTSSSSSSCSSGVASKVHLQAPKAKRFTPAAKQKNDLNEKILSMLQQEENRPVESDDELDLSFAAYAKRMRLFLTNEQKEDVMQEVHGVISTAINNARAGLRVTTRPPVIQNNVQNLVQGPPAHPTPPPPPLTAATTQPIQSQQSNVAAPFYIHGPTSMAYEVEQNDYTLKDL